MEIMARLQVLRRIVEAAFTTTPADIPDAQAPLLSAPLYAVGDVHGCDGLLEEMLAAIRLDAARSGGAAQIVFLGDLVNRGPGTRSVLARLSAGPEQPSEQWIVLRGNHEDTMLDGLARGGPAFQRWLRKGGVETLRSYGLARREMNWEAARAAVDPAHVTFLAGLPHVHRDNELLFVHAGIRPGVALADQSPVDLVSIRGPFLSRPHGLGVLVVHGHTPTKGRPGMRPGRINLDTGAVTTGILTAAAFDADRRAVRFLQVGVRKGAVVETGPKKLPFAPSVQVEINPDSNADEETS